MKTDKNTTEALTRLDGLIKACIPENVGDRFMVEQLTKIRALLNTHPEPTLKNSEGLVLGIDLMIESLEVDMNYGDSELAKKRLKQLTKIRESITPTPETASEGEKKICTRRQLLNAIAKAKTEAVDDYKFVSKCMDLAFPNDWVDLIIDGKYNNQAETPETNEHVLVKIKRAKNGEIFNQVLKYVDSDDHNWRTVDDNSELNEMGFNVESWRRIVE